MITVGLKVEEKGRCKNGHTSLMFNGAWCDKNTKGDELKLHDMCPNSKCKGHKQISFTPR